MSKFSIFYNNVQGQHIEVSSWEALYQCMDLMYLWVFCNDIPKVTVQQAMAKDVYKKPKDETKKYFDLIPNTRDFIPQTGDICVFDGNKQNPIGHVAIATGEGTLTWFKTLDQNWAGKNYMRINTHNYDSPKLLGVLRIKK